MTVALIAGGCNYELGASDFLRLDVLHARIRITEVVSGAAPGADTGGELWASNREIPIKSFPYERRHGKSGGRIRNMKMAKYVAERQGVVVLFPGRNGTEHMYECAQMYGLEVYDWRNRR